MSSYLKIKRAICLPKWSLKANRLWKLLISSALNFVFWQQICLLTFGICGFQIICSITDVNKYFVVMLNLWIDLSMKYTKLYVQMNKNDFIVFVTGENKKGNMSPQVEFKGRYTWTWSSAWSIMCISLHYLYMHYRTPMQIYTELTVKC